MSVPIVLVRGTRFSAGLRHLANLDAPEAVTDAVRRFAREL
ncbi:hypothetical protein [Kitasatospora sp. NPDC054795]